MIFANNEYFILSTSWGHTHASILVVNYGIGGGHYSSGTNSSDDSIAIRPAAYLNSNIVLEGSGTESDPFVIIN